MPFTILIERLYPGLCVHCTYLDKSINHQVMMGAKNQFVKKNPNIYLFDRKLIVVASKLVMKHKRHELRNLAQK